MSGKHLQADRGAGRGRARGRGRGNPTPSVASSTAGSGGRSGVGGRGGQAQVQDLGTGGFGPGRGRGSGEFRGASGRGGGPPGGAPGRGFPAGPNPRGRGGLRGGGFRGGRGRASEPPRVFASDKAATVDSRLSTSDQLVQSFRQQPVQNEMPLRPGWGTLGSPGAVRTNFFAVTVPKTSVIYDYKVVITPQAKRAEKARIFHLLESSPAYKPHVGYVAHDRSQRLVSSKELPQPLSITLQYIEEGTTVPQPNATTYTIEFGLQRQLDMSRLHDYQEGHPENREMDILPMVSAWNLILQHHAATHGVRVGGETREGKEVVGKSRYFFPMLDKFRLSLGIEAWKGFFISVRPMFKQLTINVNVAMAAFYVPGKLSDAMFAFEREAGGLPPAFVDKLKISTIHRGYVIKQQIASIAGTTARQTTFPYEGRNITVEEFFHLVYNIRLEHADDLPVINLSKDPKKPRYLPAEICNIYPGQPYHGKLSKAETAEMIKYACNLPHVNAESIVGEGFATLGLLPNTPGSILSAFGVSVSTDMAVVPSRRMPPPGVTYGAGRADVRDGSWNIMNVKLHEGGDMTNWAVLLVQERGRDEFTDAADQELVRFLETFVAKCRNCGLNTSDNMPTIMQTGQLPPVEHDPGRQDALRQIRETLEKGLNMERKPAFVLVLLGKVDPFIRSSIKRLCDCTLGLHTVHMLLAKARIDYKQDQYFSNVVLKVNAKLGGVNHKLDEESMQWLTEKKTMVVGIDVTHPGPDSSNGAPSLASVVASVDDSFAQFPASLKLQQSDWNKEAKEMVEKLDEMMVERLMLYQKRNKQLPDQVFVYRDGVSEGQYGHVLQMELPLILRAFERVSPNNPYRPKLTITVCGKRHHARAYPTNASNMDKKGNTPPGTVIDKGITDVYNHDFYLQAHAGLQGQVRPTHYVVVYDEQRLSADQLQQGTHTSSYNYIRATKAVSLVPPAYYADIAAERGRDYISPIYNKKTSKTPALAGRRRDGSEAEEKQRVFEEAVKAWDQGVHPDLRESMFYI